MKTLLLILDGASDCPLPELDGRTPLEAAHLPHLSRLRHHGSVGRMVTAVPGLPLESAVCTLKLLGYDPRRCYPGGRASFEAMGQGICLGARDLALRCNLVSVQQEGDGLRLTDFTANGISDAAARAVLDRMSVPEGWSVYPGQSYRNLLVVHDALALQPEAEGQGAHLPELVCAEPHQHIGARIDTLWPQARADAAPAAPAEPAALDMRQLASQLQAWMLEWTFAWTPEGTQARVQRNATALGQEYIMPWIWSPSRTPQLPAFTTLHGLRAAVVAGLDFMRGIGAAAGMQVVPMPGASGGLDSDLPAKARAAIRAWKTADMVIVHVNAPDEAAHQRDVRQKIRALEAADQAVLGPLLAHACAHTCSQSRTTAEPYRILVCADHPTLCRTGRHGDAPPFWVRCDVAALEQAGEFQPHTKDKPDRPDGPDGPDGRWEQALASHETRTASAVELLYQ